MRLADAKNVDVAEHRKVMQQALGDSFATSCREKLSTEQIRCALAATNSQAISDCTSAR